jgi:UDP-2,3-diacylglucosamine hydrolase
MTSRPVYLTSDVHLGAIRDENEAAFLRWIEEAGAVAGTLVIDGDLFDYWFEYGTVIPQGYTRALGALAAVVDAGVPVHLVGGNHDWWGGRYLEEEVGLHFHREPLDLTLAGRTAHLAHGDGLGPGDVGYKILRTLLRSWPFRWAYRWLHPDLGSLLANGASSTHLRGAPQARSLARAETLERWARETLHSRPEVALVVLGHTHVPALVEVDPGRFYLNCGDWVYHRTFAVLEEGAAPSLLTWSPDGAATPFPTP